MKVALRADAGPSEGVGHVMRMLALAGGFAADEVRLLCGPTGIPWLERLLASSGIERVPVREATLGRDELRAVGADVVVVDSYRIPSDDVSDLYDSGFPVTLVCDGDTRGCRAALFVDHNLGAEEVAWPPEARGRILAGARYSLVREQMLEARRQHSERQGSVGSRPRTVVFAGGSDVRSATTTLAGLVCAAGVGVEAVVIAGADQHEAIRDLPWAGPLELHEPTPELPLLLGDADVCITAAGTSAWDVLTVGLPSAFLAVVDNQEPSLDTISDARVGLSLGTLDDVRADGTRATSAIRRLLTETSLRRELADRSREVFDGRGRERVAAEVRATARSGR